MSISQTPNAPPTNAPIARCVTAFRVVHFDPGSVIGIGSIGNAFKLFSNAVFNADAGETYEEIWLISGNVVIEYSHRVGAKFVPAPELGQRSTSTSDVDTVLNVAGPMQLLAANPDRRQVTLMNLGTQKITISKVPNPPAPAAVIAGSSIIAILQPGLANLDGKGGTALLGGYAGPIYANSDGACLVAVGAY